MAMRDDKPPVEDEACSMRDFNIVLTPSYVYVYVYIYIYIYNRAPNRF